MMTGEFAKAWDEMSEAARERAFERACRHFFGMSADEVRRIRNAGGRGLVYMMAGRSVQQMPIVDPELRELEKM